MRILIVTGIFPPDIGGPATYVPLIAQALATRGHAVTVLTLSDNCDHDDRGYPFQVVRLPRQCSKPWRWLRTIATLTRLGREADVLYVNGLSMEAVLANVFLRKRLVSKIVGDEAWERARNRGWVRDDFEDFQRRRHGWKVEAVKALRAWSVRRADHVVVPSHYLARWVGGWGVSREKIITIYNAADAFRVSPAELPMATTRNVAISGRLVSWKHVDSVMEAMAPLQDVGLVIIGDGPELSRLKVLASALAMNHRVYFAGTMGRKDALALITACDVFVLNSAYEGLPHVVLEAMILGVPVVATAVGGTLELIEDERNGRLIPPMDARTLQGVLSGLLANPTERRRLAQAARESVRKFDSMRMADETCALFRGYVSLSTQ